MTRFRDWPLRVVENGRPLHSPCGSREPLSRGAGLRSLEISKTHKANPKSAPTLRKSKFNKSVSFAMAGQTSSGCGSLVPETDRDLSSRSHGSQCLEKKT